MKECVVVLGMHRSGTSVLTGLVSLFGGYLGAELMSSTRDNPRGYFENNKVYLLNEKILREQNASWDNYSFVVEDISDHNFQSYVVEAKAIIEGELKYVKSTIMKDPRICILFPIWEQALKELGIKIKILFAYRSPLEVAQSIQKRDGIAIEKVLMIWSHYFLQSEFYSRKFNRMIVEYDADFKDLPIFLERLADFIGFEPSEELSLKAKEFYSPSLKHHQVTLDNISDDLPLYLLDLITLLSNKELDKYKTLDRIRNEFFHSKKYYLYNEKYQEESFLKKEEELVETHKLFDKRLEEKQKQLEEKQKQLENTQRQLSKVELTLKKTTEIFEDTKQTLEKKLVESKNNSNKVSEIAADRNDKLKEKEIEIQLLSTSFYSGEKLFRKVISNKTFYKTMRSNNAKIVASLELKKALMPFAKNRNKRAMEERILILKSGLFSPFFYLTIHPDVKESGADPLSHYCKYGWKEGRNPSLEFDTKDYLRRNPDVARVRINPLLHYIKSGKKEGRRITSVVLYGKCSDVYSKKVSAISSPINNVINGTKLVGPIFEKRWDNSISVISVLNLGKKLVNEKTPPRVLELSNKQLEISSPRISVIMATWNREGSICKAIDSILSQSYLPFEIIISDDGSTDKTIELLHKSYQEQILEGFIRILQNTHKGVSEARNTGLAEASGDLIAYLDSDNLWREHYLLIMSAAFSENDELNCAYSALQKHDKNSKSSKNKFLSIKYNRKRLLDANFIDLNVFMHRRFVYQQFGGFDTELKRLVDWELVIRYTKNYEPALIPFVGVDYFLDDKNLKNITTTVSLGDNRERVYSRHFQERLRHGLEQLRIAYVLWDFPALSQTFVMEELKWLVEEGYDVVVYFAVEPDKSVKLDFEIPSFKVKDADELSDLLIEHQRNLCHSHFAYPTVTKLTYPACVKANIPFTFMPHAVDIFHHENKKRNNIAEITQNPLCIKVLVHGEFHKKFIEDCGVPSSKIAFNIQAVNVADFTTDLHDSPKNTQQEKVLRGVAITRFVEKKGINTLIDAAVLLRDEDVVFDIYGYGSLEEEYRKQIKKLGIENVFLKGALSNQQQVAKAYEKSDFLITPCVVAENGDMDGFPTVILEAMAVGLPVITTDIAAIPDYLTDGVEALVAPAGDVAKIAESVRQLIGMSAERKLAMIKRSQNFLDKKIGVEKTMQMLLDTWQFYTVDIFLVTFNTKDYDDRKETTEIINRIFKYTTTPFTLTIIDNDSDDDFWEQICNRVAGYSNVRLIRKRDNKYCGPASNIALELSDSEFAIYICSKEGFIKSHGWERTLLEHMRSNPNDAIAGHHSQMPSYIYGKEYENHPDFLKFRNPEFARKNPNRVFKHVQGGIYILRREFIKEHGGFNPQTPHGGMDIEMSYYMESLGYGLGEIPEVASLTVKTIPRLPVILSERTVIAHPLTVDSVANDLDLLVKHKGHSCNVCGWKGDAFLSVAEQEQQCPSCHSIGFGRSVLKLLANNHHIYRSEKCLILSKDKSLKKVVRKLFKSVFIGENEKTFLEVLGKEKEGLGVIIIDSDMIPNDDTEIVWEMMLERLSITGEVIFSDASFQNVEKIDDLSRNKVLSKADTQYCIKYEDFSSYCVAYDWRRFGRLTRVIV